MLGGSYQLEDGTRVRLRLARGSDGRAVGKLLGDRATQDVTLRGLVHFDPRQRSVVCATALIDGHETLVGIGSVQLGKPGVEPELILADEQMPAVRELLADALSSRAAAVARPKAA
jgi:hypothetical protein